MKKIYIIGMLSFSGLFLSGFTTISSETTTQSVKETEGTLSSEKVEESSSEQQSSESNSTSVETEDSTVSTSSLDSSEDTSDEKIITEEVNKPMGTYAKGNGQMRSRRSTYREDVISATEVGRPPKSFIDISSWNGAISAQEYGIMKGFGISGVVVKLTEYTNYKNPERFTQIKNARAQGLKVSVYHYSHFRTKAEAVAEARYFANAATEMGLSRDTIMVNDAEEPAMNNGQATENSLAFEQELKSRGFNNVIHYSMGSWFTGASPVLNPAILGRQNIWVANYPYNPVGDNLLYKAEGYSAWQWSSALVFPNISIGVGVFDINTDYAGRFTGGKVYDTILEQNAYTYSARVVQSNEAKVHGIYDDVNNTRPGIKMLGTGERFSGQKVTILASARTNRSTYLKFYVNGMTAWMDSRAFKSELDTSIIEPTDFMADIKSVSEASKHGLYTEPNNTSEKNLKLGTGLLYANQSVRIINIAKISTGVTAYQFTLNGQIIGWMDSRAFKEYDKILEQNQYTYMARILPEDQSKIHGVYDGINNTGPGIKHLAMGNRFANQRVTILSSARTTRSTYLKFSVNGTIAWMDRRAFKSELDSVTFKKEQFTTSIKPVSESSKHGLYTNPNNTSEQTLKLGTGSSYANRTVEVVNSAKISTGVMAYQFSRNGQVVGWLDSRAFKEYDKILEQNQYTYMARVLPENQSKIHGVYDDINNTRPEIKLLGMANKFANQKVTILASARTNRSTYLKFSFNGTIAWMDARAVRPELDKVVIEKEKITTSIKSVSESNKHGLYTQPNNTSLKNEKLGLGSKYAGQKVEVIQKGKISNGVLVYQFKLDNQLIGWLDSRAFN
ncbi:GW dipeptide domain-containing protein [Candidatus Enterococcus mansonii]|uniref:GW domain-containing protein n=1 Tax=Candidatus Enterococcus mansonii TaxID=1834181 RepID=A0A242CIZ1_9ENTE|nr:GW dipeptide domain-containing protein [Enterococcus sp. 4G2_DIV0659]OTO09752.1 hypothetical protein A5880_000433 [Enterococcus sp. 4G2_DIV0659]